MLLTDNSGNVNLILRWTGGVMLCLAWLNVLHVPPWTAFYSELAAVIALLLWGGLVVLSAKQVTIPFPAIFLLGLAAIPPIQSLTGLICFRGDALMAASYLGLFALSVVVGHNLKEQAERFGVFFAWTCLVGALVSVYLALNQWLALNQIGVWQMDMPLGGRPYANLGQPNNLATLLCLGLASAVYLRERGRLGGMLLALLILFLLIGIAMTRSRTGLLAMFVMALWLIWGRSRFGFKTSAVEAGVGFAFLVLLWVAWPTFSDWLMLSAESTVARIQQTFSGEVRLVVWTQLLDAVWRQPLTGYGWNQVSVAQMEVVAEYPNLPAHFDYSHNLIIDLLVWNGLLLGGVIVLIAGVWLYKRVAKVASLESWFALLIVLLIVTHSMVEFPHAYAYFLVSAGIGIGLLGGRSFMHAGLSRPIAAGMLGTSVLVASWIFVEYQAVEADFQLMRFQSMGLQKNLADASVPRIVLLDNLQEFIQFARTEPKEGMTDEELNRMRRVAHRYPYPPALMRHALALGLNHRPEEAALELRRLRQVRANERFDEVRMVWPALVERYPQLAKVTFPPDKAQ